MHAKCGIPKKAFLPVVDTKVDIDITGIEQQRMADRFVFCFGDDFTARHSFYFNGLRCLIINLWSKLVLRCTPELINLASQFLILSICTIGYCCPKNTPGRRGTDEDKDDRHHSNKHIFSSDLLLGKSAWSSSFSFCLFS